MSQGSWYEGVSWLVGTIVVCHAPLLLLAGRCPCGISAGPRVCDENVKMFCPWDSRSLASMFLGHLSWGGRCPCLLVAWLNKVTAASMNSEYAESLLIVIMASAVATAATGSQKSLWHGSDAPRM